LLTSFSETVAERGKKRTTVSTRLSFQPVSIPPSPPDSLDSLWGRMGPCEVLRFVLVGNLGGCKQLDNKMPAQDRYLVS
jgi:hypothetical protein